MHTLSVAHPFVHIAPLWPFAVSQGPQKSRRRSSSILTCHKQCRVGLQVSVDVPRTAPEVSFLQHEVMQTALRRLLYIWGVRHPASGYVQGVNDLVTPFLTIFLSEYLPGPIEEWDVNQLTRTQLLTAEADSYWCLSKLVGRCAPAACCTSNVPTHAVSTAL
jgi:hypothetical protein